MALNHGELHVHCECRAGHAAFSKESIKYVHLSVPLKKLIVLINHLLPSESK